MGDNNSFFKFHLILSKQVCGCLDVCVSVVGIGAGLKEKFASMYF